MARFSIESARATSLVMATSVVGLIAAISISYTLINLSLDSKIVAPIFAISFFVIWYVAYRIGRFIDKKLHPPRKSSFVR
jgi:hypothetical protein